MKDSWNVIFAKTELEIEIIDSVLKVLEKYRLAHQSGETSLKIEEAMSLLVKVQENRNVCKRVIEAKGFIELMQARLDR